jgi:spore maturation protein CgeB
MRIFHATQTTPNPWYLPQSRLWHVNLYLPLVDLGHELVTFRGDYGEFYDYLDPRTDEQHNYIRQNRPKLSEDLLRQVKAAQRQKPIDLLFAYFYSAQVEPEAIREIGRMGITTVNWYCNGSFQFHLVEEIAPAFDYCLVPEKFRLADYRRVGANPIYCQEAANPSVYKPHDLPAEYDVTFVGQRYGNRPDHIKRLIAAGVDVRVWGPRWDEPPGTRFQPGRTAAAGASERSALDEALLARAGPALADDELVKMYSRSRISLGFSVVAQRPPAGEPPIKQVRLRDFEAPMSGAFYLVERCDELTEFFEPGKEIVFFDDADELADKAKYYLAHDAERERIRQAGMRRARSEHTWQQRFAAAFRQMGLKAAAA